MGTREEDARMYGRRLVGEEMRRFGGDVTGEAVGLQIRFVGMGDGTETLTAVRQDIVGGGGDVSIRVRVMTQRVDLGGYNLAPGVWSEEGHG